MTKLQRFFLLWAVLTVLFLATGCTTTWITEANNIIAVLIPAAAALLATLSGFGMPTAVLTAFTTWSGRAQSALTEIGQLVADYQKAEASAQPGILGKIDSAIKAILAEFPQLLAEVHVADPKTQQLWTNLANDFANELKALLHLIPVVKGEVADHDHVLALVNQLKSAKQFKHGFNEKLKALGQDTI